MFLMETALNLNVVYVNCHAVMTFCFVDICSLSLGYITVYMS